jgi:hemolysin D
METEFDKRPSPRLLLLPLYVVAIGLILTFAAAFVIKIDDVSPGRGALISQDGTWLAEIEISAADISLVRTGQSARAKIDAFPFAENGAVAGTVDFVAAEPAPIAPTSAPVSAAMPEEHYFYTVRIRLDDKSFLTRQSEHLELRVGMPLTGEITTRSESLAALLLRPLH